MHRYGQAWICQFCMSVPSLLKQDLTKETGSLGIFVFQSTSIPSKVYDTSRIYPIHDSVLGLYQVLTLV